MMRPAILSLSGLLLLGACSGDPEDPAGQDPPAAEVPEAPAAPADADGGSTEPEAPAAGETALPATWEGVEGPWVLDEEAWEDLLQEMYKEQEDNLTEEGAFIRENLDRLYKTMKSVTMVLLEDGTYKGQQVLESEGTELATVAEGRWYLEGDTLYLTATRRNDEPLAQPVTIQVGFDAESQKLVPRRGFMFWPLRRPE